MSFFDNLIGLLPTVKDPSKVPNVRQKLLWTLVILVIYFILGTITLIGLNPEAESVRDIGMYQTILASDIGTLITLGIGPIVLASIILQLLAGVKIINFDFSKSEDRARFSGAQKLLAIVLAVVEAIIYSAFGMLEPLPGMLWLVVLQIVIGAIIVIYLDEVVSKYGIGSGIGLFIAAGVCQAIIWRIFSFPIGTYTGGLLFQGITMITTGATMELFTFVLLPILFTLLVFFAVVYVESVHVNIPLTVGRSGMGANFPVKLMYISNMPVILTGTLFANIALFATLFKDKGIGSVFSPIANFLQSQHGLLQNAIFAGVTGRMFLMAIGYAILFVTMCVIFGKFWVEVGGQGTANVAGQLQRSGMSIPGFRRDERVLVTVLNRYIPVIVILGSIIVGLLAVLADFTGAIGTGTGILLTVGIVYRFYEQLAKEQLFESGNFLKTMLNK